MGAEIPVIEAGVAFVVRDGSGQVLLHRRQEEYGWSPPSGTLRGGEKIGAGLGREIREETGLDVELLRLVAIHSDPAHQVKPVELQQQRVLGHPVAVEMGEGRTPRPRLLSVPRLRAWSALFISLDLPRTDALPIPPGRLS